MPHEEEGERGQTVLRNNSLSTWPPFPEAFMKSRCVQDVSGSSVFTFLPLLNLHLKISKFFKEYTLSYCFPTCLGLEESRG